MARGEAGATAIGFGAALLWASLALLTAASGSVPPFQLAAMCFAVGGLAGAASWAFRPQGFRVAARALRQPPAIWAVGVGGLFGYHFLYFSALRAAPPVEASLIAYLWPLLIVLLAALGPGGRLRAHHLAGALLGFLGAALIVTGGGALEFRAEYATGYGFALAAAFVWAGYSVLSRRFASAPTDAVAGFCLVTSALAALSHLALEEWVWPAGAGEWLAILGLGLGPVGLAFYLWDYGVKRGDIGALGAASYAAPLLSTLLLVAAGRAEASWTLGLACLLIAGGAVLASLSLIRGR